MEETHHGGALLFGRQYETEFLFGGQQKYLIWSRGQAGCILGDTLVITRRALAIIMTRLLFDTDLGTGAKATNRWLAIHLIGSIDTIVLSIATEILRDAVIVLALELIVPALGQRSTHLIRFIIIVATIVDTIAQCGFAYAQQIGALEGIIMAMHMGTGGIALIAAIQTIVPAIAFPA